MRRNLSIYRSGCVLGAAALALALGWHATAQAAEPAVAASAVPPVAPAFELRDGDRVVLLGDTFIEREGRHGFLELALLSRSSAQGLVFRNLGWSGDTVQGDARSYFGPPEEGFTRLREHLKALKPTVVIACYGATHASEGQAGIERFLAGYRRLLDELATHKAKVTLLSPLPREPMPAPYPDAAPANANLGLYRQAIARLAQERGLRHLDAFQLLGGAEGLRDAAGPMTDNGIHLLASGYRRAAPKLAEGLGLGLPAWRVQVDAKGQAIQAQGAAAKGLAVAGGTLRFMVTDAGLPLPPTAPPFVVSPADQAAGQTPLPSRLLQVTGLAPGKHELRIAGQPIVAADAQAWERGVEIQAGPSFDQAQTLRLTILRKNELYFHRWRPANETYLFGFRKHEQGNNAVEIPKFDPLVAEQEKLIESLRAPKEHAYELAPAK